MNNLSTVVDTLNTSALYPAQQSTASSQVSSLSAPEITAEELTELQSVTGTFPFDDSTWGSMSKEELTLVFWSLLSYIHTLCANNPDLFKKTGDPVKDAANVKQLDALLSPALAELKKLTGMGIGTDLYSLFMLDQIRSGNLDSYCFWQFHFMMTDDPYNVDSYHHSWWYNLSKLTDFLNNANYSNIDFSTMKGASDAFAIMELFMNIACDKTIMDDPNNALRTAIEKAFGFFLPYDGKATNNYFLQALTAYFYKKDGGDWTKVKQDLQAISDVVQAHNDAGTFNWNQTVQNLKDLLSTGFSQDFKDLIATYGADILHDVFYDCQQCHPNTITTYIAANVGNTDFALVPSLSCKISKTWLDTQSQSLWNEIVKGLITQENNKVNKN